MIGRLDGSYGYYMLGNLDEFRISKGIARWTANFTPPSSPYGKVYTVTGTKKFGAASGEFHGSGDYLSLADSGDWNFGSGDFTIDTWFKLNALNQWHPFVSQNTDNNHLAVFGVHPGYNAVWFFLWVNNYKINIYGTTTLSTGVWYHAALVHTGNTYKLFLNGTEEAGANDGGYYWVDYTSPVYIGYALDFNNNGEFTNGMLDEPRISKGIARWTANFTPPTAAYGTTTTLEKIHAIASANTWETDTWDISAVQDADKNVIDQITATITHAGADNTFYLDNMRWGARRRIMILE